MAFDPILPLYFGYFFKLHNQYHFGYILAAEYGMLTRDCPGEIMGIKMFKHKRVYI